MTYTYQVKTGEYEYINGTIEGTAEEAVAAFRELKTAWEGGVGLPQREWCQLRDKYLSTGQMEGDPGILETLSAAQRWWVNETKKGFSALKRKEQ